MIVTHVNNQLVEYYLLTDGISVTGMYRFYTSQFICSARFGHINSACITYEGCDRMYLPKKLTYKELQDAFLRRSETES